jgi:Spy/CpxP family protein refolding chaperone
MKVIYGLAVVVSSMLLGVSAMAGTPPQGQHGTSSSPTHAAPATHTTHSSAADTATKEKLKAIRDGYREKRDKLEAELKTERANLRKLEAAHPQDKAAVTEARSQVASTRKELREARKAEQAEIAKVLTEASHSSAHANTAGAKTARPSKKPHASNTP